jgi:2-polyprenyl-3-methyl-5-hydroxy-6-metoxy-1,4-benzoquinol methylase
MAKDWSGNHKSVFITLGASSHSKEARQEHDYYATENRATELLLTLETFSPNILEPCCGGGHMSEVLIKRGYNVESYGLERKTPVL